MPNADPTPLVSVAITTYLHEPYIAQCIQSVLDQGVEDIQVYVLDDASPDATAQKVAPFLTDPRLHYIRNETNLGAKPNNTRALGMGSGRYLVWMHGDDYLLPGHLADALAALEANPACALAYSPCYWVDEEGRILALKAHPGHLPCSYAGGRNEFAELLVHDNYLTPSSVVLRREALTEIGTFDQDPHLTGGDWDLFVRMAARHDDFAFIDRASTAYRIHAGQFSNRFYANDAPLNAHVRILEKALDSAFAAKLQGWEMPIGQHLEQRFAGYPEPSRAPYRERVEALLARLEQSARNRRGQGLGAHPKVSVVVPTMNRPELLQDALQSLLAQSYAHWDAVVVNDAGCDVAAFVSGLDPRGRIRYINHSRNRGLAAARNTGIRLSDGEILCYLDDDDVLYPDHLETLVRALQDEEGGCVYTDVLFVQEELHAGARVRVAGERRYADVEFSLERLHVSNFIPVNAWAHRRSVLGGAGLFDEEMVALEDWDLLLRIARATAVKHIPKVTAEVRERGGAGHLSVRARGEFPELFRRIYARYDDLASPAVAASRQRFLAELEPPTAPTMAAAKPAIEEHYAAWCEARQLDAPDGQLMAERMVNSWAHNPSIHLLSVAAAGSEQALAETLESLGAQLYKGWGMTVLSDVPMPEGLFEAGGNLEWIQTTRDAFGESLGRAIAEAAADWVAMLDLGDRLAPQALFSVVDYINLHPEWRVLYCDSDVLGADGSRGDPRFLPEFNLELLRSTPYFGSFCLFERGSLTAAGGVRSLAGVEAYDLALRVLEREGESVFGHIPDVLLHQAEANRGLYTGDAVRDNARAAVQEHLRRSRVAAQVHPGLLPGSHFIEYLHEEQPLVSIIIPTKDRLDLLQPCVESLVEKTTYPNYEVLVVDNNSSDPATLDYLASLEVGSARVRVLRYPHKYNFSAINNHAVRQARGDYLLLLNNDTQVVQPQWLERMMAHAQRPDVGIVGARLVFADQRLQHAGVVLGMGAADHPYIGLPMDAPGYMGRAQLTQNYSAVTAACLLTRREVYEEVGGLDEGRFKVLFNDVDFCLKVGERGYRIVWTPYATVVHHGSSSLKSADHQAQAPKEPVEAYAMFDKWLPKLAADPAHNRNLSLRFRDVRVDANVVPGWNTDFHDRPRVLGYPLDAWGSGHYRVRAPLRALREDALVQSALAERQDLDHIVNIPEMARLAPDTIVLQGFLHDFQLKAIEMYRRHIRGARLVYELDDLKTEMPAANPKSRTMYKDVLARLRRALGVCDRLVVSTEPLKAAYADYIDDIVVVPNRLERARWEGLCTQRRAGARPRVGWAGAQQHHGDLALLREVVQATAEEVDWVFLGMCPPELRPHIKEFHEGVLFERYPEKLAGLNLDLAVAPLEVNRFNEAKSNLRLLEYGILGWPVVCTDIEPYRTGGAPVARVANRPADWIAAIRERVHDLDAAAAEGDCLRAWVRDGWILEEHLEAWMAALTGARLPARKSA